MSGSRRPCGCSTVPCGRKSGLRSRSPMPLPICTTLIRIGRNRRIRRITGGKGGRWVDGWMGGWVGGWMGNRNIAPLDGLLTPAEFSKQSRNACQLVRAVVHYARFRGTMPIGLYDTLKVGNSFPEICSAMRVMLTKPRFPVPHRTDFTHFTHPERRSPPLTPYLTPGCHGVVVPVRSLRIKPESCLPQSHWLA